MVVAGFFSAMGDALRHMVAEWLRAIFVLPFANAEMLWVLIPVWAIWFFVEFFQEKHGTTMGGAVSNSVVLLWGSVDCARQTTHWLAQNPGMIGEAIVRYVLIGILFAYGALIVMLGVKGNLLVEKIGRIRTVMYLFIMLVPVFYGEIEFSLSYLLGAIMLFPLFYYLIELIDRNTPDFRAVILDARNGVEANVPRFLSTSYYYDLLRRKK